MTIYKVNIKVKLIIIGFHVLDITKFGFPDDMDQLHIFTSKAQNESNYFFLIKPIVATPIFRNIRTVSIRYTIPQ